MNPFALADLNRIFSFN